MDDLIVYWDDRDNEASQSIGRWFGPSHHIGSALCYFILAEKATVLSRTSVQHITKEDFETQEMKERVRAYHESLNSNMDSASEYILQCSFKRQRKNCFNNCIFKFVACFCL